MKMLLATAAFSFATVLSMQATAASPTAQPMTCDQAQASYYKNRRIHVIAHGSNVLPIYGMQAYLDPKPFRCTKSRSNRTIMYYFVKATDRAKCPIAKYCG